MPRHSPKEELRLIDQNIKMRSLEPYWCEICGRKLMYQKNSTAPPQCPYCLNSKGLVVPMKKYFFLS